MRGLVPWVLTGIGAGILAVLVWLFGPLAPGLADPLPRLGIAGALLAAWLAGNGWAAARRVRQSRALARGIAGADAGPGGTASHLDAAQEQQAVGRTLTSALAEARQQGGGTQKFTRLPWYVIIGPPGAGKTTALLNAGLDFPLAGKDGQAAVAGVGGTRLCDWWFTASAVLIDTAGRYTTQDSDAATDRAGWFAFLDLLRRTRPRQPLNGVIVAIGVTEVADAAADQRNAHAAAVRARIGELQERLGVRLPVYVWFTKADLLAGFTEFFEDLDRTQREQVWGVTFPLEGAGLAARFSAELRALVERLHARLPARLQAEPGEERRSRMAGFPLQVATLEAPLAEFLDSVFRADKAQAPLLRGVYFTSGTQEGTPVDRLIGAMARSFGLNQRRPPALGGERGRSYFLTGLLRDVIFNEAMLVRDKPEAVRRARRARGAAFAAIGVLVLLAGGALLGAWARGASEVAALEKALDGYEAEAGRQAPGAVDDDDLPRLLPLLDAARDLAHPAPTFGPGLGLSQSEKLEAGAAALYRHALGYALLPRLLWRLETQMRGRLTQPGFLYEVTRIYLMLGGEGPLNRDLVLDWMAQDWRAAYPGVYNAPVLATLRGHLAALLDSKLPGVTLDGGLVQAARATFAQVPLAARVYSRIKPLAAGRHLAPWRPAESLGLLGGPLFVRGSGKPLSEGVAGFFTRTGFHEGLLAGLEPAARAVAAESWVLGKTATVDLGGTQLRVLEQAVIRLYEEEYAASWDGMLADLQIVPLRSVPQAAQSLFILGAAQSPLRSLLASVAAQLTLSGDIGTPATEPDVATAQEQARPSATTQEQARLAAATPEEPDAAQPGREIDLRYRRLRDLVQQDSGAALDRALQPLIDLQQQMAKLAAAPVGAPPPSIALNADPAVALDARAKTLPAPLGRWLQAIADQSTVLRGGNPQQHVAAAYNGATGPGALCPAVVNGRFPFTPASELDAPLTDFARLLAPGGLLDGFRNTELSPYLDSSGPAWKLQRVNGAPAPITMDDAGQFQRAAAIRDLFFAAESTTPALGFDITPEELDAGAREVRLVLDGASVVYAHGQGEATQISWPGPTRTQNAQLIFDPPPRNGTGVLSGTGPWALFRLFGQGTLAHDPGGKGFRLSFTLGERHAAFLIRSSGKNSPFAPDLLPAFRCPAVQ